MRKSLCIVLILLICFFSSFTYAEENNENNNTTNGTKDLQSQRDELKNQLNEASGELGEVQSNLSENLQQIEKLDEKISSVESQLEEQESKITKLKENIENVETELEEVSEKYNKQKELFKQRIVAIYEAGETHYLDILLKSRSLSDFLSSYYIITELAKIDNDLLDELEYKKEKMELGKKKLENEKKELSVIAENQTRLSRTLQNTKMLRQSFIEKLSQEERELQEKIDDINRQYAEVNQKILQLVQNQIPTEYTGGLLAWPVPGYTTITSSYGMRVHPITGHLSLHTGVDVGAPTGVNFVAANDGVVTIANMNSAYGNMVMIDHGGGVSTLYAHGSEIVVEVGQFVKRGEPVLKIGSTGLSTGPHAHFEVRLNGTTTDPIPYITNNIIPSTENNENTNK